MEEKIIKKLMLLSDKAQKNNEVPVSALIVRDGKIISTGYNRRHKSNLTVDHAEITAISNANRKLKSWRLNNCSLYVTFEPCEMCSKVIEEARIDKVYYLVGRLPEKKNHNKTEYIKLDTSGSIVHVETYLKKVSEFWKKKRKK